MMQTNTEINHHHELSRITGVPLEDLLPLLTFIDASKDLYAFKSVLVNFLEILKIANDIQFEDLDAYRADLEKWVNLVQRVLASISKVEVPDSWEPKLRKRRRNLIGHHPIYSILTENGVDYSDEWLKTKYGLTLTMVTCIKNYNLLVEDGEIAKANSNHEIGTRSIRGLEVQIDRTHIPPSPFGKDKLDQYVLELTEWNELHNKKWATEFLCMANSYIQKRGGYSRQYRESVTYVTQIKEYCEPVELGFEHHATQIRSYQEVLDSDSKAKINRFGLHHDEFQSGKLVQLLNDKQSGLKDKRANFKKLKGINQSIIALAQHTHYNNSELTPFELFTLFDEIQKIDESVFYRNVPCGVVEIMALVYLSAFTGRTLADVQTLRFLYEQKFKRTAKKSLTWCPDTNILYIPAHVNEVHNNLDEAAKAIIKLSNFDQIPGVSDHTYSIILPSFVNRVLKLFYEIWKDVRKEKRIKKGSEYVRTMAFSDIDFHREAIDVMLTKINRQFDINITIQKISQLFKQALLIERNDQAEYTLLTHQNLNHGVVASHYYSIPKSDLTWIHMSVVNYILKRSGLGKFQVEYHALDTTMVGSKLILSSEIVKAFIADQLSRISDACRQNNLIKIHNAYTTYIIALIGFASGYRAIRDPINFRYQISDSLGFICISDKDSDDNYHTRLVPIAQIAIDQIREYEVYLQSLVGKLGLHLNIQNQIRNLLLNTKAQLGLPYFFYLTEHYRISSISPRTIKENINEYWRKLPANINRHYIRTRLRFSGCPAEFVDYFLGHWEQGEEPFNSHSFVSPIEIKSICLPFVESILKEDGWKIRRNPYA